MTEQMTQALAKINEYRIQKKTIDGAMTITLPRQFVVDNDLKRGDRIAVYRNAMNPAELIVRVEKHEC